jgi:hypothetical protein
VTAKISQARVKLSVDDVDWAFLSHKVMTTMTIRFAAEEANSCMAGKWKRVLFADQTS